MHDRERAGTPRPEIEVGDITQSTGVAIGPGATATSVTEIKWLPPKPVSAEELAVAEARLAARPVAARPGPAPLPTGSRILLRPNPLFVGRDAELRGLTVRHQRPRQDAAGDRVRAPVRALLHFGDYTGARSYYERALGIRERVLGPGYPSTETVRESLAVLERSGPGSG